MARTQRDTVKQKVDQCRNNLDRAMGNISDLFEMYPQDYPKQNEALAVLGESIIETKRMLDWFRDNLV